MVECIKESGYVKVIEVNWTATNPATLKTQSIGLNGDTSAKSEVFIEVFSYFASASVYAL